MDELLDKIKKNRITRRSFLKWSAATGAMFGFSGPNYKTELVKIPQEKMTDIASKKGKWVTAACWHNCGGSCLNKAYIVDGIVVRQKTDDTHLDSLDYPQQRACARGRSQRKQVLGADRLKYPMKRKNWSPGGGNKELRGKDEWIRITWEEALDIVSSEIKRVKENHGNESIYLVDGGEMQRPLAMYGGYVAKYGSRSRGAWAKAMQPILGVEQKSHVLNDRYDLLNANLIVLWGNNPAWSSAGGNPMRNILRAKEKGIKVISIDPLYNNTAAVLADEFIPIRPASDTPMMLAMAYTLLKEDSIENPLIDWEFLKKCTIGFDENSMPEGTDKRENFKDYVLGTYDGQPKSPEWAADICGVPAEKIKSFALEVGKSKPVTMLFGWNSARIQYGQHVCLAQTSLAAMTGNVGIKGGAFSASSQEPASNGGPALVKAGKNGVESIENPIKNVKLCTNEHWEAILSGKYTAGPGNKKDIDIRVIYHSHSSTLNQTNNINKGIKAHKKVEFVVTHQYALNPNACYSDVVLPVTTEWERIGNLFPGNREMLIGSSQVMDPIFEAKDDSWIAKEIGRRLGLEEKTLEPISSKQQFFNKLSTSTVIDEDGKNYGPLITITSNDLNKWGVKGKVQTGKISLDEFMEKGIYQVQRHEGDNYSYVHNEKFRNSPEKSPLKTESGKIEIHCKALSDMVTKSGWNQGHPIARYVPAQAGYEATFANWENKTKGKYPLQVCSIHAPRQTHSNMGNVNWLRETFECRLMINTIDANERGIAENDTVRIFNDHGSVLRKVHITERVMPGVIVLPQGSWVDLDEYGNCRAGATNVLTGDYPSGPDLESFQACIAEVEKHSDNLKDDHEWDQKIVF